MNLAIVGATGNVGRKTLGILEKSKLAFNQIYLVASKKSAGQKLSFREKGFALSLPLPKVGFCPV